MVPALGPWGENAACSFYPLIARFVSVGDADYDTIRAMVQRAQACGFPTLR